MEISNMITNEMSELTKRKIHSAVISKRSINDRHGGMNSLSINSPLITNRGSSNQFPFNESKPTKQPCTPAMPSRPKGMDLTTPNNFFFNKFNDQKIQEEDDESKVPEKESKPKPMFRTLNRNKGVAKPPLPFERKEVAVKSSIDQISESKNNTTMETTPEIKKIGFDAKLAVSNIKDEEEKKLVDEDSKFHDNLKAFNKYLKPLESLQQIDDRKTVTFTPAMNKRKLNREVNTNNIDAKKVDKKKRFPDVHLKTQSNFERFQKDDNPLLLYSKNKSVKENKVKESFNILQKLGGASTSPSKKKEKFEIFKMPDFTPKAPENSLKKYSFQRDIAADNADASIKEEEQDQPGSLPGSLPDMRKAISEPGSDQKKIGDKFEKKLPGDFRRNSVAVSQDNLKPNKKSSLYRRNLYGKKKKKILSVIQEEIKGSQDVTPLEEVPKTPYYQNAIFGENKSLLYYSSPHEAMFKTKREFKDHLTKILEYNKLLKNKYENPSAAGLSKPESKRPEIKSVDTLLMEIYKTSGSTFMEKQLQTVIDKTTTKDFLVILDFNITKIQQSIKQVNEEITKQQEEEKKKTENKVINKVKKMEEFSSSCSDSSFSPSPK